MEGENTINVAEQIGVGSQEYNLINVDGESGNGNGNNENNNSDDKANNDNNDPNDDDDEDEISNLNGEFLRSKNLFGLNLCLISLLILIL